MVKEDDILMSRNSIRPQLTGKLALDFAKAAFDQGRYANAERLLTIAHKMFAAELPHRYRPSSTAEL